MKNKMLARLEALESRHPGITLALVFQNGRGWSAAWSGKKQCFETLDEAQAFLKERTDTVIIIDV